VRTESEASPAPDVARREIAGILASGYLRLLQERARGARPPAHLADADPPEKRPETLSEFP
jgi:hypothetical protein